ncbi:MAG: helix-turn-helix domain-containing protein [Selenomonadaceae bacterium]|nr:helix-turn-helix domain-containing protein [Selenomonadaceae bacterium]
MGRQEAAKILGVNVSSIRMWIRQYESEGAFLQPERNRVYSEEMKLQAVKSYLAEMERDVLKK